MALTGQALLPDIGIIKYATALGTADFTCLYTSDISGKAVKDAAGRTVKYMEYTLSVDAIVTLQAGNTTTDNQMALLRRILDAQAGMLTYSGKGFGYLVVNPPGANNNNGNVFDVNWGPKPETIQFIPLGGSLSAQVKWVVTFCIPEINGPIKVGPSNQPVLQFNFETKVTYGDDYYSGISYTGTLELPLTRPTQGTRTLTKTVDDFRVAFMARIVTPDLFPRFRVKSRNFGVSRDKRTLEFSVELEEVAPMGLPPGIEDAEGEYTIRPLRQSRTLQGTVMWICSLSMTYTIPNANVPKRLTWLMFVNMWAFRMGQSQLADPGDGIPGFVLVPDNVAPNSYINVGNQAGITNYLWTTGVVPSGTNNPAPGGNRINGGTGFGTQSKVAIPLSLTIREGLCRNSKTVTYEATWQLTTRLQRLLLASGLFRPTGIEGGNLWAASMANISGGKSWLKNRLDPAGDVIVDFGS
jgi:hypothetical protein